MNPSDIRTRVVNTASHAVIRLLHLLGQHALLARLCAPYVMVINENGVLTPIRPEKDCRQKSVLALDADRFRADLELLSKHSDIRFLSVSWGLLGKLLDAFVTQANPPINQDKATVSKREAFAKAPQGSRIDRDRVLYRDFLQRFLPHFYAQFGIKAITSTDSRFRRQMDIGWVSSDMGVPYICFYREGLYLVPALYKIGVERHQRLAPFHIDVMAVQNEITKEMLISSGAFEPEDIIIRGCPRMDSLLRAVKSDVSFPRKKQIALFSSPSKVRYGEDISFDLLGLMQASVRVVARIAMARPDVHVVIKLKDQHLKDGILEQYRASILQEVGEIPANISFNTDRMAAHDVIFNSTIVCALQSTVVLEAAIAGRPVILPHFKKALEAPHAKEVLMYIGNHQLFDVPASEEEMENILLARLDTPDVAPEIMAGRRELFERYVSPLDADNTSQGVEIFRKFIAMNCPC